MITLGVLSLEAGFHQLGDDAAGARLLGSGQRLNASRKARGERHALP
jgi:hypothetical protein